MHESSRDDGTQQMHFSGSANCPKFAGNPFRKNFCVSCQQRIDAHSGATQQQIVEAIEYAVDKVPSEVWRHESSCLFVGGYKASINVQFLSANNVGMIVHACPGIEKQFGSKVEALFKKRRQALPQIEEFFVKWEDSLSQRIDDAALWSELLGKIHSSFVDRQVSVLVHCAQGKSRSAAIAVAYVAKFGKMSVTKALEVVQAGRKMAQPNHNFMSQLADMEKSKVFDIV